MKKFIFLLASLLACSVAGWLLLKNSRNAENIRDAITEAEITYLEQLDQLLATNPHPAANASLDLFVSANVLNQLLAGLTNYSAPIEGLQHAVLTIRSVKTTFKDGFPEIRLSARADKSDLKAAIDLNLVATLVPQVSPEFPSTLILMVRPVDVNTVVELGSLKLSMPNFVNDLFTVSLSRYADLMPRVTIPLVTTFPFGMVATAQSVSFPTQNGALNGVIEIPSFSTTVKIAISQVLFLSDGLHISLIAGEQGSPAPLPYNLNQAPKQQSLDDKGSTSQRKEKDRYERAATLRAGLAPKLKNVKIESSDARFWVASKLLSVATGTVNSLTPEQRVLKFRTTSEVGQIYRSGGGGLGCGGYANLVGGNSANANMTISNVNAVWVPTGAIDLSADMAFSFNAQVTGHINSAAGFCIVKNIVGIPGVDFAGGAKCSCPIGGGVGLGNYGIRGDRTERVTARMTLKPNEVSWLSYNVAFTAPSEIPITIEVGLGQLGHAGFPITIKLPNSVLASGYAPSLFENSGTVQIAKPVEFKKSYRINITPKNSVSDASGYSVLSNVQVKWE